MVDQVCYSPDEVQILSCDQTATPSVISQLEPGLEIVQGVSEVTGVLQGQSSSCLNNSSKPGIPRALTRVVHVPYCVTGTWQSLLLGSGGYWGVSKGYTRHAHGVTYLYLTLEKTRAGDVMVVTVNQSL